MMFCHCFGMDLAQAPDTSVAGTLLRRSASEAATILRSCSSIPDFFNLGRMIWAFLPGA
jgi:hypothetical protein